jgi:hypothetical protein
MCCHTVSDVHPSLRAEMELNKVRVVEKGNVTPQLTLLTQTCEDARVHREAGNELMTAVRQPRAMVDRSYAREIRPYTVLESAKLLLQPGLHASISTNQLETSTRPPVEHKKCLRLRPG